jgi:hypothetical protein
MGKASMVGRAGALLAISLGLALGAACGEVTASGAEETQLCAKKSCEGKDCPPGGQPPQASDAGARCVTNDGGASGSAPGGAAGTTGVGGAVPTEVAEFPCTVCRKAENCCKAEGLTDCGYTAACASSTSGEKTQFYLALCRTVLSASTAGPKTPGDVCGL